MSRLIGSIAAVVIAIFGSVAAASTNSCESGGTITGTDGELYRPYHERTFTTKSGAERKWLLRLPSGYDEETPADVVFLFHGATSTAERVFESTDFEPLADRDGVILVMPDANKVFYDQSHELARYWNSAWEAKWRERDYDVDFVLELVDLIKTDYCAGDFYTAGMSAGGDMTTALQCLSDSPFLSYAPVTYRYYNEDECKDAPPRPMLSFHGSEDKHWSRRERDYDVDFVLELVDIIKTDYCAGDFYTAGMSAGGDMTTALQCLSDSPFLSYAPVTYRYYNEDECKDAPPRPMLSFHGSEDKVVPLEGLDAPWFDAHMSVIMQSWAEHNGCNPQSIEERVSDEVLHYRWNNCEAAIEWYLIEGGGHTWPGNDVAPVYGHSTTDISATQLIWQFFFEH